MILVDTTVWIDFFNNNSNEKVQILTDALKLNTEIFITDIILTEILQGIREDKKYVIVKNTLLGLSFVHAKDFETYIHASNIYRECRKKGITIRKTIDCLIGAITIENDLTLLNNDFDFINMAKCVDLKIL